MGTPTIDRFVANLTTAELSLILPEGLRSVNSLYCRCAAYDPLVIRAPVDLVNWAVRFRNDPEYAKSVGHKRAGWLIAVACCVAIVVKKYQTTGMGRTPTAAMVAMVDPQNGPFPPAICEEFLALATTLPSVSIRWAKDQPARQINVPSAVANDAECVAWAATPWPQ